MSDDRRRAQYVPLDTGIGFGKTATRLKKRYGRDGLLTWVLFLAACKRSMEQGTFIYTSESEGWQLLGLPYPDTPGFELDKFFAFTGRGGGTRIVRSGSIRRVSLVNWKLWNEEWKKQQGSERMSRKRAQDTRTEGAPPTHIASTEGEGESEGERRTSKLTPVEKERNDTLAKFFAYADEIGLHGKPRLEALTLLPAFLEDAMRAVRSRQDVNNPAAYMTTVTRNYLAKQNAGWKSDQPLEQRLAEGVNNGQWELTNAELAEELIAYGADDGMVGRLTQLAEQLRRDAA